MMASAGNGGFGAYSGNGGCGYLPGEKWFVWICGKHMVENRGLMAAAATWISAVGDHSKN